MAEQQQSIKVIFDKIMRHPLLQDLSIETIVDYSIDFMRIVGVPSMFEEKVEKAEVINYRADLPCDYYQMVQIRALDPNYNILGTFRYSSDSFHMSDTKPEYADYSYKVQGNIIYLSVPNGLIEIAYQAIPIDSDGYPLIPDNSSFTRALEAYIKKQHFTILFDLGKIGNGPLAQVQQDYAWAVGDCQSEFNRLTIDKAESFYNSWRTLIIRSSEHRTGFLHNGTQEKLKMK